MIQSLIVAITKCTAHVICDPLLNQLILSIYSNLNGNPKQKMKKACLGMYFLNHTRFLQSTLGPLVLILLHTELKFLFWLR